MIDLPKVFASQRRYVLLRWLTLMAFTKVIFGTLACILLNVHHGQINSIRLTRHDEKWKWTEQKG